MSESPPSLYADLAEFAAHVVLFLSVAAWLVVGLLHAFDVITITPGVLPILKANVCIFAITGLIQSAFMIQYPETAVERGIEAPLNRRQKRMGMDKYLHPETERQSVIGGYMGLFGATLLFYLALTFSLPPKP